MRESAASKAEPKKTVAPETDDVPRLRTEFTEERPAPRKRKRFGGKNVWIGSVLGIVVIALLAFSLMESATLAYTPKTADLDFKADTYVAYQSASAGQLSYSIVKLSDEKSVSAPASGEETVSEKASGTIIVYNEQTVTQRLIKTTRFETPEGLIFRTPSDVSIPAKGNVEITVVADQPGAEYNVALTDFTLPGLKGTATFEKVYARSKTPMSGGFVGTRKKVSDEDLAKAKTDLDKELKDSLISQARAQVPADFILFPELSSITYSGATQGTSTGSGATVTESANLIAVIFKRSDISQYLALQKLGNNNVPGEAEIRDFSKLNATFFGAQADLTKVTAIRIQIDGSATVVFATDESALASDIAGLKKEDVQTVLKRYPSIEKASTIIRPFWKSSFPSDAGQIKIVEQ